MATEITHGLEDLRQTFLRHLPKRVEAVARRIEQFHAEGWDINGLSLLHSDAQRLAGASGRHGLIDASELLLALESLLESALKADQLPDSRTDATILEVVSRLRDILTSTDSDEPDADSQGLFAQQVGEGASLDQDGHGSAQGQDSPEPGRAQPAAEAPARDTAAGDRKEALETGAAAARPTATFVRRVYHLSRGDDLSQQIDNRLAAMGCEVEVLESADELREVLSALPPDLVVVGAGFSDRLEAIGAALLPARQRTGTALPLIVITDDDAIETRLLAHRAHADAVIAAPASADPVLKQIGMLLTPERESPYRVLIVEDDRSQGVFAESILRNAGMLAQVVDDPMEVLPVMTSFGPDLVLMDLHMPKANGMELTALIRERTEFLNTPIVFLSGESDEDIQFEALEAGGDDFIAKPVRPRHLIAAVQNRVRRARAASLNDDRRSSCDPTTGLYRRSWLLDRINHLLDAALASTGKRLGGVLYLEVEGATQIRERLGLAALEHLLTEAGRTLVDSMAGEGQCSRLGDASFLLVAPELDIPDLMKLAAKLHRKLAECAFKTEGTPIRLRCSIGVCAFAHGFADAGTLLTAVERACRHARGLESGVSSFDPPKGADRDREGAIVDLLREAIEKHAFELLFQPIVAVQGSEEAQYQTLLRLRDDSGDLHLAAEIVPLAERANLIVDIDRWVVKRSLEVISQRRADGRSLRLFIPQSLTSMLAGDQVEWFRGELEAFGLHGGCIVLEVRMADAVIQSAALRPVFRSLQAMGVQLCLSQFELLPESERLINELPLGYAKLAGKYLAAGGTQDVRDELRQLIDDLHRMNVKVVGHRVEDAQAAATLWISGIDLIQGNLVQQAEPGLDFDFDAAVL